MEEIVINAEKREVIGKQVRALRREGKLPAVLYGSEIAPLLVSLDAHESSRILSGLSSSHLVVLDVNGERHTALVREKQRHPVRGNLLHIDFQVVSMTRKLRTSVPIELVGEASAVREFNGVVVTGLEALEVECLPNDLPERVSVDISILREIGDAIYVHDIALASQVEVLDDPDEMIALVTAQAAEEEEEKAEEIVEEGEEPEVIERGKREEGEF